MNNRFASGNAALTLKIIGIILILSFLLDFLVLMFPFQPTDRRWQIELASAIVDRGIVPLVGIGMLFVGYWIESFGDSDGPKSIDIRFPVLIFSSVLGLIFLLIFPLHLNNVRQASLQSVEQIRQDAEQAENQLQNQLSQFQAQFQAQINNEQGKAQLEQLRNQARSRFTELLNNDEAYEQAINNPELPPGQKELLQNLKENPEELESFIAEQTDPQAQAQAQADQRVNQIRQRREAAEKQAKENARKSGLRIGISSLLLSIGYIIIGWTGLRSMGALQGSKRKVAAR